MLKNSETERKVGRQEERHCIYNETQSQKQIETNRETRRDKKRDAT